jgi:hypothetical protein
MTPLANRLFSAIAILWLALIGPPSVQAQESFGPPLTLNPFTGANQLEPSVARDASDLLMVTWSSSESGAGHSIRGRCFDVTGAPTGNEFPVSSALPTLFGDPEIARSASGATTVVWGRGSSVSAQRFNGACAAVGTGIVVSETSSDRLSPAVAIADSGIWLVVWESSTSSGTDNSGTSIQGRLYDAGGLPQSAAFQVNTTTLDDQVLPSASIAADGTMVVVWNGEDGFIRAQRYDALGAPAGGEIIVGSINGITSFTQESSIAHFSGSGFVVVWNEQSTVPSTILARRFDASGNPLGAAVVVTPDSGISWSFHSSPVVDVDSLDNFVVAWYAGTGIGEAGILGRRYDSSGVAGSDAFLVRFGGVGVYYSYAGIAMDSTDEYIIVYLGPTGIEARISGIPTLPTMSAPVLFGLVAATLLTGLVGLRSTRPAVR